LVYKYKSLTITGGRVRDVTLVLTETAVIYMLRVWSIGIDYLPFSFHVWY